MTPQKYRTPEIFTINKIYFEDPTFTALDRAFLETHGYEVLESLKCNGAVNSITFAYLPDPNNTVAEMIMLLGHPMLLVKAGDLGWHYRLYRTRQHIKELFDCEP